ncbi:MAG: component of SufBCD complex [Rhodobacterales bacterium]|nr:MAG: component of SufBCD complex [Rhodobacterales bacterium]
MDYTSVLTELIDTRSFSNMWYWIGLAVIWSSASHFVLGVPWDLVLRAKRGRVGPAQDVEDLVRINVGRLLYVAGAAGLWILGLAFMFLTMLLLLGFVYYVEFAQAVVLIALPMTLVGALSLNTAKIIQEQELHGAALYRRLYIHRTQTQFIGMIAIFITAIWGMYQNMTIGALGS